ncbi:sodium- and chloride-dependent betaine transporter-like [Lytechinus pictus]|uniref:sodium- and chloride-dependent betaine transporter-like n=1 Tax=Lytechinus pictus TaxID=7653 RepID=UPI0030B9C496
MNSSMRPGDDPNDTLVHGPVKSKKSEIKHRGSWSKQIDFFLTLCGGSVGLGNVWRFPYLCYKHGGGAFLVPYFLCVVLGGIPLLVIEIGIGQFTGQGPITAWTMLAPLFKGIGVACLVVESLINTYYVVIMAWGLYYLFWSFKAVLPYSTCDNEWNTRCCLAANDVRNVNATSSLDNDTAYDLVDDVISPTLNTSEECGNETTSPTVEFWNRKVLQIHLSEGIHDIGHLNWHLLLCLILAWIIVYFCICKGVKSSGKVVYFTVPFPYILLTILLVRAVTLPNALEGIIFYLKPDLSKLKNSQVWLDAATQIFFSNSLGQGVLVALGSYNRKTHNFVRDTLLYSAINSATSIYAGFVIFAVLGFMSGVQGKPVADVASSGPGLGFIAYPEAITQTPLSTLWAILFFLTLLLLGIDSQFVCVEGFITTVVDLYPKTLLRGYRREMFCAAVCAFYCILAIPVVTNGGMYIFQLFDYYSCSGFVLLWIAIFESTVIGWVYGGRRFMENVTAMTGMKWISPYMIFSWMFATPIFAGTIFLYSLVAYEPLKYENEYTYPGWGYFIGIMMAVSSMVTIPIFIFYQLIFKSQGSLRQRWNALTTASIQDFQRSLDEKNEEMVGLKILEVR